LIPVPCLFLNAVPRRASQWRPRIAPSNVVRTNGSDEVLARAANLLIGRAAFETAKRKFPKDLIEYRNGAQIIERNDGTCA
jgi:hypothetical protein